MLLSSMIPILMTLQVFTKDHDRLICSWHIPSTWSPSIQVSTQKFFHNRNQIVEIGLQEGPLEVGTLSATNTEKLWIILLRVFCDSSPFNFKFGYEKLVMLWENQKWEIQQKLH